MKNIALISLTERGRALSERIADVNPEFEMKRFCFAKNADEHAEIFDDLSRLTADIFDEYDALIFVCACGIAVRMIAPHVRSKQTDPAVLAIDDRGQYVIPLLSGHLGGANALSKKIAETIGAEAIITTATDIGGQFSPDSFAAANHLMISDMNAAKEIAAAVLNGEMIGFQCAYPYQNVPSEISICKDTRCGIVVADSIAEMPFPVTLRLIPKNIVLGIGCKKGVSTEQIESTVETVLAENGVNPERIIKAASIDLKANETGLLGFCKSHAVHFCTYSADELMAVPGDYAHSDFAEKITGADNICERSAVLCSGGKLVIRKTARNGVTVAAAEMPVEIDFEKRLL